MTGKHHLTAGTVVGLCTATSLIVSGVRNPIFIGGTILTAMLGSLFPDLDSRTSKLGSKLKLTSAIISKLFGHRGFFHSLLFSLVMAGLCIFAFWKYDISEYIYLWQGFIIGILNHLFCDMFTKGGVPFLYPFCKTKFRLTKMKSGSKFETLSLSIVCLLCIFLTYVLCKEGIFLPTHL